MIVVLIALGCAGLAIALMKIADIRDELNGRE